MKKKSAIAAFVLILAFLGEGNRLGALDLRVTHLEGRVETQRGASWVLVSLDDSLSSDAVLRLREDSFIELRGADLTVKVGRPGTYSIRDLLASSRKVAFPGIGRAISAAFSSLVVGPTRKQQGAVGVRGGDVTGNDGSDWVLGGAQDHVNAALDLLKSADYERAIERLAQARQAATDEEMPQVSFLLGYAWSQAGNPREALKAVSRLSPAAGDSWALDFIILKARLLVDTSAYEEEVGWLAGYEGRFAGDVDHAAMYYFLLGLGYRGLGDAEKERASLSRVVAIAGEKEVGMVAAELLRNP